MLLEFFNSNTRDGSKGDIYTTDKSAFSFYPDGHVMAHKKSGSIQLNHSERQIIRPTSFAPVIRQAIEIVKNKAIPGGCVTSPTQATAIIEAD